MGSDVYYSGVLLMDKVVVYATNDGGSGVHLVCFAHDVEINSVTVYAAVGGAPFLMVSRDELPAIRYQAAWILSDTLSVDIECAKEIAHGERRRMRDDEMAQWDALIAKQIPRKPDDPDPEAERQKLRDKYTAIQEMIDKAESVESLEAALSFNGEVENGFES